MGQRVKILQVNSLRENRRPEGIIESFDSFKDGGIHTQVLFNPLNKAANVEMENLSVTNSIVSEIFSEISIANTLSRKVQIKGINRKLTRDEAMFIYANSFNDVNIEHLKNSGVSEQAMFSAENILTDTEKDAVDTLINYYDNVQYAKLNKVYQNIKGVDLPKIESYFPINSLENMGDIQAMELDIQQRGEFLRAGVPQKFTKERTGGKGAFRDFSFFKTVYRNLKQVEHYISHAEAIRDTSKYLRDPNVKQAIIGNHGQPIYEVLDQWIKDTGNGRLQNQGRFFDDLVTTLRGNYVIYALGGNLSTVIKQPVSFIQGMGYVGAEHVVPALGEFMANPVKIIDFAKNKSTQMKNRAFTQERELQEILAGRGIAKKFGQKDLKELKNMLREGSMMPILWADRMTVSILWRAAYKKSFAQTNNDKEAIASADKAIRRTQPQSRIVDLPDMFRSDPVRKMLTIFKNQPNQNTNLIFDSYLKYKQTTGDKKMKFKRFTTEMLYYFIGGSILFGLVSQRRLPKDAGEFTLNLANQALGGLPILGDFVSKIKFPWGSANMIDATLDDAAKIVASKKVGTKLKFVGRTAGKIVGVPGYVAAERLIARESLPTKLFGGEKEKKEKKRKKSSRRRSSRKKSSFNF